MLFRSAADLDQFVGPHVGSVRTAVVVTQHMPFVLFTIGDTAFAIAPFGLWAEQQAPEEHDSEVVVGDWIPVPSDRSVEAQVTTVDDDWFPLDVVYHVPLRLLAEWIATRMPHAATSGQLEAYRGPRLFGEHFAKDVVLTILLEGCDIL